MKKDGSTGRQFESGGHAPFREDLVAWPSAPAGAHTEAADEQADEQDTRAPTPSPAPANDEVLRAELAFATGEVRRLLARVQDLVEENERLRRQIRTQFPRSR